jgi:long-chain acyl-CoA synthetase
MQSSSIKSIAEIPNFIIANYGLGHSVFSSRKDYSKKEVSALEFSNTVSAMAAYLSSLYKGRRYALLSILSDSPDWLCLELAVIKAGGIHVPVSALTRRNRLLYILQLLQPEIIICSYPAIQKLLVELVKEAHISSVVLLHKNFLIEVIRSGLKTPPIHNFDPNNTAVILFTSGSSDEPKAVCLSHKNLKHSYLIFSETDIYTDKNSYLSLLSFGFSGGRKLIYAALFAGVKICFASPRFKLEENFKFFLPDVIGVVPDMLSEVLELGININKKNILVICGGAHVQQDFFRRFDQLNWPLIQVYGLTETASLASNNTLAENKWGTVGKAAQTVEIKISAKGEVLIKGDNVALGTLEGNGNIKNICDEEGWFHTGDGGYFDSELFLKIEGRLILCFRNSEGVTIFPEKAEGILESLQWVEKAFIFQNNFKTTGILWVKDIKSPSKNIVEFASLELARLNDGPMKNNEIEEFRIEENYKKYTNENGKLDRPHIVHEFSKKIFYKIDK